MPAIPQKVELELAAKEALTPDVWRLDFRTPSAELPAPGQFFTFFLAPAPNRAYSVAWAETGLLRFVVKRVENGGGGSRRLCDLPVGAKIQAIGPAGRFVLPSAPAPRLFVGTGTGFAPLYFQARAALEADPSAKVGFLFGVRSPEDVFAREELEAWVRKYPNFSFRLCLSRGGDGRCSSGRVTDFLTAAEISGYREFSLCGSPAMVADARALLEGLGVPKEKVFFEQY